MSKPCVYVGSGIGNWQEVQEVQERLRKEGLEIVHDWADIARRELTEEGFVPPEDLSFVQVQAVREAQGFLLLTPGGRGAHVELGVALGQGKPTVVVCGPLVKPIGFYELADAVVPDAEEGVKVLAYLLGAKP